MSTLSYVRQHFGALAPKFADVTDQVLYDDIWTRPDLSPRDRCLVTVAALVALNRVEQLSPNIDRALAHGVKHEELVELITHLAFYAGWPVSVSAFTVLKARG